MKKKYVKQLINILLVLCLLFGCTTNTFADTAGKTNSVKNEKVKVGIFSLGKFMGWDDKGNVCGYNIDYLNKIAQITHWDYEFVKCENWIEATQLLENGDIDLLAPAQITDDLSERFDYAKLSMGTESAAIYTKAGRDDLLYEDFKTMADITYGCAENSTFAKKFVEEYSVQAGFTPKIKYYANTTELEEALNNDWVDAVVTNIMFASSDKKLLGWFSPLPVYYIAHKGNQELLDVLDSAMIQITVSDPGFAAGLLSNYFPIYDSTHMTYDEMQYIKGIKSEINIGYLDKQKPLAWTDEDGKFCGITRKIMDEISESSGIKFNYIAVDIEDMNEEYLKEHNIYVIANYDYLSDVSFGDVSKSEPYLETNLVFAATNDSNIDTDASFKMAVSKNGRQIENQIHDVYPNADIIICDGVEECFQSVLDGDADCVFSRQYTCETYMSKPEFSQFRIIPVQGVAAQQCLITVTYDDYSNEMNEIVSYDKFISIIDKSINQISNDEINSFIVSSTAENVYNYTFHDFAYKYRYMLLVILLCLVLIFILACVVIVNRQHAVQTIKKKNDQLALAVDKVKEANSAKSQFLAQMSHEIRTPMNAIIGLTTIARNDVTNPEKMADYLVKIDGSSRLLLGIINDILDMSAIENHKMKIAHEEFDFKQLLTSITTVFYQQCKQKDVKFEMRMNGSVDEILVGDSLRVNQILMNLLSNAVKFTPAGGNISVVVNQASSSNNIAHIRFVVSDTGCGMSDDLKKRLFNPFEQEDATTAKKHGGSGLGLSITKNLIEMMKGSITVESEKNVGTQFTVDIPFGRSSENTAKKFEKVDFSDIKALIVDDDKDSCEYASVILDRLGVKHKYVTSGEEALDELGEAEDKGERYSLCLVDWKMPNMDGLAVAQNIREIFGKDTLIIIVSAYDLNEIEADATKAGVNFFVPKPLFQSTLFNTLMKISKGDYDKGPLLTSSKRYDFKGKKALIAEDVTLNMEVAVSLLKLVNMEVMCAEDGKAAVEMYERSKEDEIDVIFLDINMPVMDGYEAAGKIRSSGKANAKTIPIYAMTANAFTEDVTAALNAGMNGHIAKPIEADILYKKLDELFKGGVN